MKTKLKHRFKELGNSISNHKAAIEIVAAIAGIITTAVVFFFWIFGKFSHVSINNSLESDLGCSVIGVADKCAHFDSLDPNHLPKVIFEINNNNSIPIYFEGTAFNVNVMDYIPLDQLEIGKEWGGASPWINPIEWNAEIGPATGLYTANPKLTDEDNSDGYIKVEGNEYAKMEILISPVESGYYKIQVSGKYRFKNQDIPFTSDIYHLVCNSGTNEYIKREDDGNDLDALFSGQTQLSNPLVFNPPNKEIMWFPASKKTYTSNGNLITSLEWEYDDDGNITKYTTEYSDDSKDELLISCQDGYISQIDHYSNSELRLKESIGYDHRNEIRIANTLALAPEGVDEQEYSSFFEYLDSNTIRKTVYNGVTGPILQDYKYVFKDNKVSCIENISEDANDYYRKTNYYYDTFGNRFQRDSDWEYKTLNNGSGLIKEKEMVDDEMNYFIKHCYQYNENGLVDMELILGSTYNSLIDYTYISFPKNDVTSRMYYYIQLLGIGELPTF